ncbi:nucleotidyltransferase domain-containing protein [Comamonas sp. NLF-1-9]|uniref:GSU2403 family nucleotidyltransferase fold protein n=1 Tax=Comamonas sp. NLF-1-9 TaxID=2853163 RepID=UPI001C4809FC|nr:nucleotidyltransferase domain-containing protein [Comamonas sp. NLF-1-9]QXL83927.1 hypothetical protein KUD94_11880 [Comamonas sp. NLF-1-9]
MYFDDLSTTATASYATVCSAALAETVRGVASLPGSFSRKKVKGKTYWYYQLANLVGGQSQIFLGPDTAELAQLVAQHKQAAPQGEHLRQLARLAIAAGCAYLVPSHSRIVARLADAGFFKAGGILIGTHVYMAYQNLLGVRWRSGAQTQDLDFAHPGRNVSLALPTDVTMDTKGAIESLEMGFVPLRSLTTYVKSDEADLQIDFVTTRHRAGDAPLRIEALNIDMQPLKFMEFAMESPIQMVLLSNMGPIVVNAPPPERYAVHKLLVHGERPQSMRSKAGKDLEQAATLIDYLGKYDQDALRDAWQDLVGRGKGWQERAMQGRDALATRHPALDLSCLN